MFLQQMGVGFGGKCKWVKKQKPNYHNTLNEKIPTSSLYLMVNALTFSLHQNLKALAGIKRKVQK